MTHMAMTRVLRSVGVGVAVLALVSSGVTAGVAAAEPAPPPPVEQTFGNGQSGQSTSTQPPGGGNPECRLGDPVWCNVDGGFVTLRFLEAGTYYFDFTMSDADGRGTYVTHHTVSSTRFGQEVTLEVVSRYFREMGFKIDRFSYRWDYDEDAERR